LFLNRRQVSAFCKNFSAFPMKLFSWKFSVDISNSCAKLYPAYTGMYYKKISTNFVDNSLLKIKLSEMSEA